MKKINTTSIILSIILVLYLFLKNIIFIPNSLTNYTYIINPIFWIIETILCIFLLKNIYARRYKENSNLQTLLILLLLHLIIYFSSGLIFGYLKNPYSFDSITITKNIWSILLVAILEETCRFSLIKTVKKEKKFYILVTIIFILLECNFRELFLSFDTFESFFIYVSEYTIPIIVKNILLTTFALEYGITLCITYKAYFKILTLFLPLVPDWNWFLTGFSGCLIPLIIFIIMSYTSNRREISKYKERGKKQNILLDSIFYVIVFVVILFVIGVFRYRPVAIMSNSMKPNFSRGDAVVYEKITMDILKNLKEGDIVIYEKEKSLIVHRIIEVIDENGTIRYITKGDNNDKEDTKPVKPNQIRGVVKFTIKYIGYPSIVIKNILGGKQSTIET